MLHEFVRQWRQWRCKRLRLAIARWERRSAKVKGPFKSLEDAVAAVYMKGSADMRAKWLKQRLATHEELLGR
jgi:hypothetical protein